MTIRGMKIRTIMRYRFMLSVDGCDLKNEVSTRMWRNSRPHVTDGVCVQPMLNMFWCFLKRLDVVLLAHSPAVLLLSVHPKELKGIPADVWMPAFTAALFSVAKRWKPSKCQPLDKWTNTTWHVHSRKCYSAIKRSDVLVCATQG